MKDYLTTTDVAKYCHVTRLTVINWAKKGLIQTTKTPGKHRRISKNELIHFMREHCMGLMEPELSNPNIEFRWCWEYHKGDNWKNHKCRGCLVYLTHAKKCFSLREKVGHRRIFCKSNCAKCSYYKDYHDHFQWCWEFHQDRGSADHKCHECVVFLSGIKNCYILREETEHKKIHCKSDCRTCDYYKKVVPALGALPPETSARPRNSGSPAKTFPRS